MEITSLVYRTDMLFWEHHSEIEDLGNALLIRTPENPYWNWGNFLLLDAPPLARDRDRWIETLDEKIFSRQITQYPLIAWEGGEAEEAELAAYAEMGMTLSAGTGLRLGLLTAPQHPNESIRLHEMNVDDPLWGAIVQLNIECFGEQFPSQRFAQFAELRIAHHRRLVAQGVGKWFAVLSGESLAGSLGIFKGKGFYRFQEIVVAQQYRRQGIASSMTYEVARRALAERPDFMQVIVADTDGEAQRIYRSLGFEFDSVSYAIQGGRKPQSDDQDGQPKPDPIVTSAP